MISTWASVALGGTKCTTTIADLTDGVVTWLASSALPTRESPAEMLGQLTAALRAQLEQDLRGAGHFVAAAFQPLKLGQEAAARQRRQSPQVVLDPIGLHRCT